MHGFWVAGLVLAELLPPAKLRQMPRRLAVVDEKNQVQELRLAGAPTLLEPIFTRCTGTCPLIAVALKEALTGGPEGFRVVLLSFDAEDDAKDLRDFRERLSLPSEWLVVRAIDGKAAREFFDDLDFHFMKIAAGFDHPNQTFVFSPSGIWAATLSGTPWSKQELDSARRRAVAADDATASHRLFDWLSRPESWIALAFTGFVLSFGGILLVTRSNKARSTAASRPEPATPDENPQ